VIKNAVGGESVDMRCLNLNVPVGAEAVDSVFVGVYDQNIRPLRRASLGERLRRHNLRCGSESDGFDKMATRA
jgi:hypothetical protein